MAERLRREAGRLMYRATCPSCCLPVSISRPQKGGKNNFAAASKAEDFCCSLKQPQLVVGTKLATSGCQFIRLAEERGKGVVVLGNGTQRPPLAEEQRLLREKPIECDRLVEFDRVLVHGVEYRNKIYHEDTLFDNSTALTWDAKFVTINSIIG